MGLLSFGTAAFLFIGTFYFSGAPPYDWTTPQNNALWQDAAKTLFDPCPPGWRVPKSGVGELSPWNTFTLAQSTWVSQPNNGHWFPTSIANQSWYPHSGFRNASSGICNVVEKNGYHFSATAVAAKAYFLSIYENTNIIPDNQSTLVGRANSFPVRCIRE